MAKHVNLSKNRDKNTVGGRAVQDKSCVLTELALFPNTESHQQRHDLLNSYAHYYFKPKGLAKIKATDQSP